MDDIVIPETSPIKSFRVYVWFFAYLGATYTMYLICYAMINKEQANFISAVHCYHNRMCAFYINLGFIQYLNMVTFFIRELPILTYVDLIIYSLVLSGLAQLLFNLFFSIDMLLLWVWCVICWLEKDEGTYLLTAYSYVELQFFSGLIGFIHMIQLNICTLLISAIVKHLIDSNVVG